MGNTIGKMNEENELEKRLNDLKNQRKELEDYVNRNFEPGSAERINADSIFSFYDYQINTLQQHNLSKIKSVEKNNGLENVGNLAEEYIKAVRTSKINERIATYEKNKKIISDYARRNHLDNTKFNLPQYYEHFDSNIKSLQDNLEKGNLSLADKLPRNNDDIVETTSQYMNKLRSETIDIRIRNRIDTYDKQLDRIQSYVRKNHLEEPNLANEFAMDKQRLQQALQTGNYSSVSPLPDNNNDIIGPTTSYLNNMQQIQEMKNAKPVYPTRASSLDPTPALKRLEKMSKNQILPPRTEARPSNDFFCSDYSNTSHSSSMVLLDDISFGSTKSTQKEDKGKAPASASSDNLSYTSIKSAESNKSDKPKTPNNENKATYSGAVGRKSSYR
ncbi:MAG: hypothetical protein E7275_12135 [Pseudobutyrivibrio sp.]|uniref:hypothetical protein n=1 Tax=Pseudobutyrivibrio sp. TaxID=2014367 RepID=UPI0025FCBFC8|nr:hypothetical protein [Pseudobutyrivibrio sp.]MBE5905014.1 hypothetical protein [Pseudobutyrivibrio sp.]